MKPSIEWCRRCLASHAPGEHVKRAGASSPPAAALKAPAPAKRTKPAAAPAKPKLAQKPKLKTKPKRKAAPKKPATKAKVPPVKRVSVAELTPAERDTLAAAELRRRACDAQRARRFRKRQRLAEARA